MFRYGLYFYAASRRIRTVKKSCDTITVKFACGNGKFTMKSAKQQFSGFFIARKGAWDTPYRA